jgi:peptide chain release factor 2
MMQRLSNLKDEVARLNGLSQRVQDTLELASLGDESLRPELEAETEGLEQAIDRLEFLLLFSGPRDREDAILSLHAGAGGTDAQDWAAMLLRMYLRYFERNGFEAEEVDLVEGEEAGVKHATLHVKGPYAFGYLSCERGVHRLVRPSPFNADNKRQTSFSAVTVQPELDDVEIAIDWDKDVREDLYRASGAGGQHVNKTSSAVRLTHLETNLVVQCQSQRSQHQNRATARKMLMAKMYEHEQAKRDSELAKMFGDKGQIAWGNQIRSYVLDDRRVKDHRTGAETFNPDNVLDGDIQMFIDAYLRKRATARQSG